MVPNVENWELKLFKNILKLDRGSSPRPIVNFMTDADDGVNWIKIGDTKKGELYINSTKERITPEGAKKSRKVSKGEVIVSNSMSYGQPYILNIDGYIHDGWFVLRNYEQHFEKNFLLQILGSELIQRQYKRLAAGGVVSNISSDLVYAVKVGLPPLPEQRKIAKILSTWDKAIATTEKLIETSKQQKKALMQQLLTGKKRLLNPETGKAFEGEWKEVKLKQLGKCITGLTYSPSDVVDEGTLVLRSSNIQGGKLSFLDNVYVSSHIKEESKTRIGDILICVRNGSRNLIGKSAYITDKASGQAHGAFMTMFRGKYAEFVFQLFQSPLFYRQVNKNLGATINSINTSDLHKFKFDLPKDKNEIERIALVLTASDKDIETLQAKLAHFKQEKKALMQQLLTGKRRVKVDDMEVA
ncbi:restriction endonuclease subunit S [Vibrio sp. J383]|uniref:restriction endonuclease subunit S n=1 Tax=Vibrio sp. J383 TaxID=2942997 RepID=UPI0020BDEFF4|nr:restriction endonuclease subunit S [Vibrio sp. J383]UQV21198.1 restriction endonuclease subunit S [Vibrio sp. J383]